MLTTRFALRSVCQLSHNSLHVAMQIGLYHREQNRRQSVWLCCAWRVVSEDFPSFQNTLKMSASEYFRFPPSFISSRISRIF